jgi:hypothetical protein
MRKWAKLATCLGLAVGLACWECRAAAQPAPPPLDAIYFGGDPALSDRSASTTPQPVRPFPLIYQAQNTVQPADPTQPPPPAAEVKPDCPSSEPAPPPLVDVKFPFKWSWGGQYRVEPNASNFPFQPVVLTPEDHTQRFVVQRMRMWATVNPNDNVEGYAQVQFGGILWGTNVDFSKTFNGPRFPPPPGFTDTVGIVLRRAWLAYTDEQWGKVRVGFLDWHDSFGDTLASSDYDFQIGGVEWSKTFKECNNLHAVAAALLLSDLPLVTTDDSPLGSHTAVLFTLDVDQPLEDQNQSSVGASAYYITDAGDYSYPTFAPYKSSYDVWLGVRGKTVLMGTVPVNGFALVNWGSHTDGEGTTIFNHTGWAAKAEIGPVPLGPGKLSAQIIYSSGSDHPGQGADAEFRTVAQTYRDNFGSQGYWSYLHLTSPSGSSDVNDLGVSLQNRGLGLITAQAKYDYPLYRKLSGELAAGWLWSDGINPTGDSKNIGGEVCQTFTYDFGGGLKLDTGVAVLLTGDFYRPSPVASTPRALYEVYGRLQLEF